MFGRGALVAVACLSTTACQTSQHSIRLAEPYSLTPGQIATVQRGVRAAFEHPSPARFGRVMATKAYAENGDYAYIVCGEVDARAGQGGSGAQMLYIAAFAPDEKTFKLGLIEGSGDTTSSVLRQCREAGIAL